MKLIVIFIVFITHLFCIPFNRLDTESPWRTLYPGDSIISTLGQFKATLIKQQCRLNITRFNPDDNQYYHVGFHASNSTKDCDNLTIMNGVLSKNGDSGDPYIEARMQGSQYSIFTIDDEGIMRLITTSTFNSRADNLTTVQTSQSAFYHQQRFSRSYYSMRFDFTTRHNITNLKNWFFGVEFGQLIIYHKDSLNLNLRQTYTHLQINQTQIFDISQKTFPVAYFPNVTYQPRCYEPQQYINYKSPYVFEVDPYWPIVTLYEQGGYKVIQVAYGQLNTFSSMQQKFSLSYHNYYSPCPPKTFLYRDECLAECPEPYFHEMRGYVGKCVLVCENYTPINITTRICSCDISYVSQKLTSQIIHSCPPTAKSVPYGCVCKNNTFFDSKLSLNCVASCPARMYARNGLCMECPVHCLTCERDQYNRNYLKCNQCQTGYTVHTQKKQCIKSCANNYGLSVVNGVCSKCNDQNCIDCSDSLDTCKRCNLLHTLSHGKCQYNCEVKNFMRYGGNISTFCINDTFNCRYSMTSNYQGHPYKICSYCQTNYVSVQEKCETQCPQGFKLQKNGKNCICAGEGEILVGNACKKYPGCPMTLYLDNSTKSCIQCPFGCMSCSGVCTSCIPGYYLHVSGISTRCLRKSPFSDCLLSPISSWERNSLCITKRTYNDSFLCLQNVGDCKFCSWGSNQICLVCQEGFYLLNNQCFSQCPNGMMPYDNLVCILVEIDQNCQIPHLIITNRHGQINDSKVRAELQQSMAYQYYINSFNNLNDPNGYKIFIRQLELGKRDGFIHYHSFYQPRWICLKCQDGMGLNPEFTHCLPCPANCKLCYMAVQQSCLDSLNQTGNNNTNQTNQTNICPQFTDSETKQCLSSCTQANKYPEFQDNILYCKPDTQSSLRDYIKIDSASYLFPNSDQNIMIFLFDRKIEASSIPAYSLKAKRLEGLIAQSGNQEITISNSSVEIKDGCFIEIKGDSDIYYLNFSGRIAQIRGQGDQNNTGISSTVYGSNILATFRQVMQTWLAYIGYIMSIVILCLHFVFIGNELLYKMDNLLIFVQSIFYFLFVKNLVGRLTAQFYFGWSFAHARFLPNLFQGMIPNSYRQMEAPCSYKLINMDGNYFRNAGFSLAWLLIFLACFAIITFIIWTIAHLARRKQIWYYRIAVQAVLAGIEFFSFNLLFFSMSQLRFSANPQDLDQSYRTRSQVLAILTIVIFAIYTIIRLIYYAPGGIYMVKRFCLAAILFAAYQNMIFILPALLLELVFAIVRYVLESPEKKFEKISIFMEAFAFMGCYLLLFLCRDAGVNTIIISIVIFLLIVYLASDLTTIYLEYRNQYKIQTLNNQVESQSKAKAMRPPFQSRQTTKIHQIKSQSIYNQNIGSSSNMT